MDKDKRSPKIEHERALKKSGIRAGAAADCSL